MDAFSLKMLTWNVRGSLWGPSLRRRMEQIGPLLVQMAVERGTDCITLQECFYQNWREKYIVQPWVQKFAAHASGSEKNGRLLDSGLMTLLRHPIIQSDFKRFQKASGVDRLANKGVLFTRIELSGNLQLDVYNTHTQASYVSQRIRSDVRISQIEEILSFVQKHSDETRPVFLLGDLNFTEDNIEYDMLKDAGLVDVMRAIFPDRVLHPMKTLKKKKATHERKVDHVFIKLSPGLDWSLENSRIEICDFGLSDHRAVFAEVAIVPAIAGGR